jgi:hypothetical protein
MGRIPFDKKKNVGLVLGLFDTVFLEQLSLRHKEGKDRDC